jgi:hypothetical protein
VQPIKIRAPALPRLQAVPIFLEHFAGKSTAHQ